MVGVVFEFEREEMKCRICETDEAVIKHHYVPRSLGGDKIVNCCEDCGNQVHMLFNNKLLAKMSFSQLVNHPRMRKYIQWKKNHSGKHKYRMSRAVREWNKRHRG